ncbi:MAG: NAD(P)/FAD-dependent oxidoreductase [Polyangiales bacterium]
MSSSAITSLPAGSRHDIQLHPDALLSETALRLAVAQQLHLPVAALPDFVIERRSIDARGGRVRVQLRLHFASPPPVDAGPPLREADKGPPVLIVGTGPAGLFCAYALARQGIPAVLLERGKPVQPRRRDLAQLNRRGVVDAHSNYCFGEGGAGTYSDGKLYTRARKRGNVIDVLRILVAHGAPPAILVDARPHIGSNKLPKVVAALRHALTEVGCTFHFGAHVTGLRRNADGHVRAVELADGRRLEGRAVVLATGHSARDVYAMLQAQGIALEAKDFAVGVRVEHPQPLINRIQYGPAAGHPALPAAAYRLATEVDGHGVFSFCMCPGGWIVPASTEAGTLVVNGMSLSKRDSPFANAGLVVAVQQADLANVGGGDVLGPGILLQRRLEETAFAAGGGDLRAQATRLTDFCAGRASSTVPATSYIPGLQATALREVLAAGSPALAVRLQQALRRFGRQMHGYFTEEAVLVGVESRTSAPLRVVRDAATLTAPGWPGLYPCGEGAGYAGGIVSAALDGMRVATAIVRAGHSVGS